MFVQRPARLEACAVWHRTPKQEAFAYAAYTTGRVNATFGVFGNSVLAAVANEEWPVLPHLSLVEDCAACGAVSRFNDRVQFINRTHQALFRVK